MLAFVVVYVSLAFGVIAAIAAVALWQAIRGSDMSDTVRLQLLKIASFGLRVFAGVCFFGFFGLAVREGILPSIPIPAFLSSFFPGQVTDQPESLHPASALRDVKSKMVIAVKETACPPPAHASPPTLAPSVLPPLPPGCPETPPPAPGARGGG